MFCCQGRFWQKRTFLLPGIGWVVNRLGTTHLSTFSFQPSRAPAADKKFSCKVDMHAHGLFLAVSSTRATDGSWLFRGSVVCSYRRGPKRRSLHWCRFTANHVFAETLEAPLGERAKNVMCPDEFQVSLRWQLFLAVAMPCFNKSHRAT